MAMYCAMVMRHLNFAQKRTKNDATNNKIIVGESDQCINWNINSWFLEAKIVQEPMYRIKTKRSMDEYREFDKYMKTGNDSNAI